MSFDPDEFGDPISENEEFSAPRTEVSPVPSNDVSRAEQFIEFLEGNARFVPEEKKWFVWLEGHWQRDGNGWIRHKAKEYTDGLYEIADQIEDVKAKAIALRAIEGGRTLRALDAMATIAASDPEIQLSVSEWDKNPWLLGVKNGVVDLKTGKFRRAEKDDYVLRKANVVYDEKAKCPKWDKFVEQILPDDDIRAFVNRGLGYSLTGLTIQQILFFLYGQGANGKSTLVEVYQKLLGDYSWKADASLFLKRRMEGEVGLKFGPLFGRRFVVGSEVEDGAELAAGRVKDLTGGDTLQGRIQYGLAFQFTPTHKLWFYGNTKPVISDPSNGIWRRLALVPFNVRIPEAQRDIHIVENLCAEHPGILNRLIEGCLEWQTKGACPPESILAAVAAYKDDEDSVGEFIQAECKLDPEASTHRGDLYRAYSLWCESSGNKYVYRDRRFYERLRHFAGVTDLDADGKPLRGKTKDALGNDRFTRPFKGIALIDAASFRG